MDIASIGGIILAIAGILGGMLLEGGSIMQVTQPTAMFIVVGGTMGAVMLQFPLNIFLRALKQAMRVFLVKSADGHAATAQIVAFATQARKSGIISLDSELGYVTDPFLKQALMLAVGRATAGVRDRMTGDAVPDAPAETVKPRAKLGAPAAAAPPAAPSVLTPCRPRPRRPPRPTWPGIRGRR